MFLLWIQSCSVMIDDQNSWEGVEHIHLQSLLFLFCHCHIYRRGDRFMKDLAGKKVVFMGNFRLSFNVFNMLWRSQLPRFWSYVFFDIIQVDEFTLLLFPLVKQNEIFLKLEYCVVNVLELNLTNTTILTRILLKMSIFDRCNCYLERKWWYSRKCDIKL